MFILYFYIQNSFVLWFLELIKTIKKEIIKKIKNKIERKIEIIQICTGCSFQTLSNALVISSLMQIIVKLFLSFFDIFINIYLHFGFLLFLLPFCVKFNAFDYIRTKIANFLYNNINKNIYDEEINEDNWTGIMECLPEILAEKNAWYNKGLVFFINLLILIRLFILQEPFLAFVLRIIVIQYFILNKNLSLVYVVSFIFIFSRIIFLLSDGTQLEWKLSLSDMLLEKVEEIPKINKKNIKIMTHWALRGIGLWDIFLEIRNNLNDPYRRFPFSMQEIVKEKFLSNGEKIKTTKINKKLKFVLFSILYIVTIG
jgi:hypothetical protein